MAALAADLVGRTSERCCESVMSLIIAVYRMDFRRLRALVGSRDHRIVEILGPMLEDELDDEYEEGEPPPPTARRALVDIVEGTVPHTEWGGEAYAPAISLLYEHLGIPLGEDQLD